MTILQYKSHRESEKSFAAEATCLLIRAARKHLHRLKGAKLAVLISVLLRSDDAGWAEVDIPQLERETGYMKHTVECAVSGLCRLELDGRILMLAVPEREKPGLPNKFHLRIFPTESDLRSYRPSRPKFSARGDRCP